ncbi:MAG: hypothetical protein K1060chlam5_01045 [Candidatus Anoxychlamydiales bacterium]|nr:hypothetical protein [Candidatus Anoxychlamydiales bacterium]
MSVICNYFNKSIKNISSEELKDLHEPYVVNKARACMTRLLTITLLVSSILFILSGPFYVGIGFGVLAIGLESYGLI